MWLIVRPMLDLWQHTLFLVVPNALGAYYRRMRSRLGAPQAITATAHKLARIFYHLWNTRDSYFDSGADFYEQQ